MRLLHFILMLFAVSAVAQPIPKNQFTTNQIGNAIRGSFSVNGTVTATNFTSTGNGPGVVRLFDSDASHNLWLMSPSSVLTNYTLAFPQQPAAGYWFGTLAAGTNVVFSPPSWFIRAGDMIVSNNFQSIGVAEFTAGFSIDQGDATIDANGNFETVGNVESTGGIFTGNGSGLTTLDASDLASGLVPTARLGSGTANGTTFLRGDQTWAVPAGGVGDTNYIASTNGTGYGIHTFDSIRATNIHIIGGGPDMFGLEDGAGGTVWQRTPVAVGTNWTWVWPSGPGTGFIVATNTGTNVQVSYSQVALGGVATNAIANTNGFGTNTTLYGDTAIPNDSRFVFGGEFAISSLGSGPTASMSFDDLDGPNAFLVWDRANDRLVVQENLEVQELLTVNGGQDGIGLIVDADTNYISGITRFASNVIVLSLTADTNYIGTIVLTNALGIDSGGTGASLTDPGANRIWGWDDTDNAVKQFVIGTGLSYDAGTDTLSATGSGGGETNWTRSGTYLQTTNVFVTVTNVATSAYMALLTDIAGQESLLGVTGSGDSAAWVVKPGDGGHWNSVEGVDLDNWLLVGGNQTNVGTLTVGGVITGNGSGLTNLPKQITIVIDGGGAAVSTGLKAFGRVPENMTVTGWDIVADQSGSAVVDIVYDTYANYPPTAGDNIAGTEKPTLSAAIKNQDTSLTTWTTVALTAGSYIGADVESASTVTRLVISIYGVSR